MARIFEPTEKQQKGWAKWAKKRPPVIQALAERFKPWTLYQLDNGDRVTVRSFCEDGTVTVSVSGQFNVVLFDREVFGVSPDDLTECDLPEEGEVVGTLIPEPTEDDFKMLREAMGIRHKHEIN